MVGLLEEGLPKRAHPENGSYTSLQPRPEAYLPKFRTSKPRFPNIRGTFLGVPTIRTIVYLGLYWGPPILGKYHILKPEIP